ncbi:hypothetical protein JXB12_02165 [candidate division KSB1 bacterium]|nr:hypothetical protein [candidate division KSB1 bacterium]
MKTFQIIMTAAFIALYSFSALSADITLEIKTGEGRKAISSYIYGTNQLLSGTENWTARRIGGNRLTGYNWENNASNAGKDNNHVSDGWLTSSYGIPAGESDVPGRLLTHFHETNLSMNLHSMITVQMAGFVSKDKAGIVSEAETAPSGRWVEALPFKNAEFSLEPNLDDGFVYLDEMVNFLVATYGGAADEGGVEAYALDNEPALWSNTHPRIHPENATCTELINRSIEMSKAIKQVDPECEIFGPCLYGFMAFYSLQNANDWNSVRGSKKWFIEYYLERMKFAGLIAGKRLLDVLDVHWYPEARGDNRIVFNSTGSLKDAQARVQAPRSLWDHDYLEDSWIAASFSTFLPLVPNLKSAIDKYYPGTRIAITEYSYGGENEISGGIAMADVLGIFGKYDVYYATYWQTSSSYPYHSAAFRIYRNYDGENSTFGNTSLHAETSDIVSSSVYASMFDEDESELHLIVINKDFDDSKLFEINIQSSQIYERAEIYAFDETSAAIKELTPIDTITDNHITIEIPRLTVAHMVLTGTASAVRYGDHLDEPLRRSFELLNIYPNPFNASCRIEYPVSVSSDGTLSIFNLKGESIKSFAQLPAWGHVIWNGLNGNGHPVPSGIYIIRYLDSSREASMKITYMK